MSYVRVTTIYRDLTSIRAWIQGGCAHPAQRRRVGVPVALRCRFGGSSGHTAGTVRPTSGPLSAAWADSAGPRDLTLGCGQGAGGLQVRHTPGGNRVGGTPLSGCPTSLRTSSCPRSARSTVGDDTVGGTVQLGKRSEAGRSVRQSLAALVAVPLGASMVLAGCGGDTKPLASSPTSTSSSSTSTAATSTTSASPTTAVAPADPDIPAAARAHTNAGAEAFVRYFIQR